MVGPNGRQITRTMLAPKREATVIDNWQVLGLRGTGSDRLSKLDNHFVREGLEVRRCATTPRSGARRARSISSPAA